jgi:2-dehydro-3-deoxygluconokinase
VTLDVLTVGEAMLRLSVSPGRRLETAGELDLHVAGAEANTAVALAQLGRGVAWVSRLPETALGRRVGSELRGVGVDTTGIRWAADGRMGVYFVELARPPRPISVIYDRAGSCAAEMSTADFPWSALETARLAHVSGITPALSPSCRELTLELAKRAKSGPGLFSVDVNYRAKLWSPEAARDTLVALGTGADLVVVTREDARDVFGIEGPPAEVAEETRSTLQAARVVVTLGDRGAVWDTEQGSGGVDAIPTEIVDRLGAGDAFVAGVIDGLLDDDLLRGLQTGTVLASMALGTFGDHVITNREEVERLGSGLGRSIDR